MLKKCWDYGLSTYEGPVKKINEDNAFLRLGKDISGRTLALAIIADGMGGHANGDIASQTAVEEMKKWWDDRVHIHLEKENSINDIKKEIVMTFRKINNILIDIGNKQGRNPGTTLTSLLLLEKNYIVVHIGDSRAYKLNINRLEREKAITIKQLTEDQTWVRYQEKKGILTNVETKNHTQKHILMQCLGITSDIEIYEAEGTYTDNDLFLLCSDGLYSSFTNKDLAHLIDFHLLQEKNLQCISEKLIDTALERQEKDNISAVIIRKSDCNHCYQHIIKNILSFKNIFRRKDF